MTRKWPRPRYAQRDFDQLWADFEELGRYFPALKTAKLIREELWFPVKWTEEVFLNASLGAIWPTY